MPISASSAAIRSKPSIIPSRGRAFVPRSSGGARHRTSSRKVPPAGSRSIPSGCSGWWFYKRSTICRTSRRNIRCATGDVLALSRARIADSIPDATTLWLFREKLAKAGLIEKLFDRFASILRPTG